MSDLHAEPSIDSLILISILIILILSLWIDFSKVSSIKVSAFFLILGWAAVYVLDPSIALVVRTRMNAIGTSITDDAAQWVVAFFTMVSTAAIVVAVVLFHKALSFAKELGRTQIRPYISFTDINISLSKFSKHYHLRFAFVNAGKTVMSNTELVVKIVRTYPGAGSDLLHFMKPEVQIIKPAEEYAFEDSFGKLPISDDDFDLLGKMAGVAG